LQTLTGIERVWDYGFRKPLVTAQLLVHFVVRELTSLVRLVAALDDELEALVKFALDLLAVFQVFRRILGEILSLFFGVFSVCLVPSVSPGKNYRFAHSFLARQLTFKVRSVLARPRLPKARGDPYRRSDPVIQMLHFGLDPRDNLHARTARANHGHPFPVQVVPLVVAGRVHQLALEVAQARDVGPLPVVQDAARVDEELGGVVLDLARREIPDLEAPHARVVVPLGALDLVPQLDVLLDEVVLLLDVLEVAPDLLRRRVVVRPELDLPRELVVDRGNVARAA